MGPMKVIMFVLFIIGKDLFPGKKHLMASFYVTCPYIWLTADLEVEDRVEEI